MRCHNPSPNKHGSCKSLNVVGSCWNGCYHLNTQLGSHWFSQTEVFGDQRKLPDKTKSL